MFSPVMKKMICGDFSESMKIGCQDFGQCMRRKINLEDVDVKIFTSVLNLWCGKEGEDEDIDSALMLASVADRFDVGMVREAVEDMIKRQLHVESCAYLLMRSRELGLTLVEVAARRMLLERFEEVANTNGFKEICEKTLNSVLDDDNLFVSKEERVLEALVAWMKGQGGELRGFELLSSVRFGLMDEEYLRVDACGLFDEEHAKYIEPFVTEALLAKTAWKSKTTIELRHLGPKALVLRYVDRGGKTLSVGSHENWISSVAYYEGQVYSLSCDNESNTSTIRVWNSATMQCDISIVASNSFFLLAVWEGFLILCDRDGGIMVKSIATESEWFLGQANDIAHRRKVQALAIIGKRLVSGSRDCSIKVWVMGAEPHWPCERTLLGHESGVSALATWEGKVVSGSQDTTIRVWDTGLGALEAILTGHEGTITALVVKEDRLFSSSMDGTIRAWAVGTWGAALMVATYDEDNRLYPSCLAVSSWRLVSGSSFLGRAVRGRRPEMRVWDSTTLESKYTMPQDGFVQSLASVPVGQEVWGCVGSEVVRWGELWGWG
jgi:WD40 repeat protein